MTETSNFKSNICIICNKHFDLIGKRVFYTFNCCSNECSKKSKEFRRNKEYKRYKTILRKNNISFDENNYDEIFILISQYMSEKTKISTKKKHETMLKKGPLKEQYQKAGKKSRISTIKTICEKYGSESEFYKYQNQKSTEAKIKKYGSEEGVSEFYRKKTYEMAANFCNVVIDENTPIEVLQECMSIFMKNKKMFNHDPLKWKITHLKNIGESVEKLTKEEVNRLYTEYLSRRYCLNDIENNGYKRTKKGHFYFSSMQKIEKYFYRSSWEENFLIYLDKFSLQYGGQFFIPDRIPFIYENTTRHYYPDVGFEFRDKKYIFEIKPQKLTEDDLNKIKFHFAKEKFGEMYFIVTEYNLNEKFIKETLLGK